MEEFKYNVWPKAMLDKMRCSKEDLAKWMGLNNISFDYALPQEWLNNFVEKHQLNYELVRTTTFYAYPDGLPNGPVSACKEIDDLLPLPDSWTKSVQPDWPEECKDIAKERIQTIISGCQASGQATTVFVASWMLPLWRCNIECQCGKTWLWDWCCDCFVDENGSTHTQTILSEIGFNSNKDRKISIWTCSCGRVNGAITSDCKSDQHSWIK